MLATYVPKLNFPVLAGCNMYSATVPALEAAVKKWTVVQVPGGPKVRTKSEIGQKRVVKAIRDQ